MKQEWMDTIARLELLAAPARLAGTAKSLCQILQVAYEGGPRWKWRHVDAEGGVTESAQTFTYHYQCVASARSIGYRPEAQWLPAVLSAVPLAP